MKIAIISDIHDNIWNLDKAIEQIKKQKVEAVIACGDYVAPFITPYLASLKLPVYACLGNGDEDHIGLLKMGGKNIKWTHLSQEFGEVKLDGKEIAFCHYPKLGELLAKTGDYDSVFHGHTHMARNEKHGKCILVNPGAICGIQKGRPGQASWALYDTTSNLVETIWIN